MVSPLEGTSTLTYRAMLEDSFTDALSSLTRRQSEGSAGDKASSSQGIGIVSFLTALVVAIIIFSVQTGFFLLLRNKLARIL